MTHGARPPGAVGVVYGLVSRAEPVRVRYIGWTEDPDCRLWQHRNERGRRTKRDKWIWSMRERGLQIDMLTIQTGATLDDEVFWIAALEPDLNGTAGGTGGATIPKGTKLDHGEAVRAGWARRRELGLTRRKLTPEERAAKAEILRPYRTNGFTPEARQAALTPAARAAAMATRRAGLQALSAEERKAKTAALDAGFTEWAKTVPRVCCVKCRSEVRLPWWEHHARSQLCTNRSRRYTIDSTEQATTTKV